jgi:exosome complex component CSL4
MKPVMSTNRQSGQFVVPGQKLGVIEEFIADAGTYVEEGVIHSKSVGYVLMDQVNKKISVYTTARNYNIPKVGALIIGEITGVQSSMANIRIIKVGNRFISSNFSGIIHISDVSFKYTENIFDAFKVGDLVRAKVISDKNQTFHLSTKEDNLGVILANCSYCGGILSLKRNELRCEECGHIEGRKVALDYEKGTLKEENEDAIKGSKKD